MTSFQYTYGKKTKKSAWKKAEGIRRKQREAAKNVTRSIQVSEVQQKFISEYIQKKKDKKIKSMKKYTNKIFLKKTSKKMKEHMKEYKKLIQCLKKIKETFELKSVEVDIFTNFVKNEGESFPYAEVYNDDYDSQEKTLILSNFQSYHL